MDNLGSIAAPADGKLPILERVLNRVFRCSHRHQTRPITLKGETFAICLDCGGHVPYSLELLQPKRVLQPNKPADEAVRKSSPAPKQPVAKAAAPPKQPVPKAAAPPKRPDARVPASRPRGILGRWTREGLWLGLLAVGFAGGIYYSGKQTPAPVNQTAVKQPVVHAQPPERAPAPAQIWSVGAVPQAAAVTDVVPEAHPVRAARQPNQPLRLRSERRFVLLAHEADSALELVRYPGKLTALIQTGALFTVPRGTAVRVVEKQERVVRVDVLEGPVKGETGWISAERVQ